MGVSIDTRYLTEKGAFTIKEGLLFSRSASRSLSIPYPLSTVSSASLSNTSMPLALGLAPQLQSSNSHLYSLTTVDGYHLNLTEDSFVWAKSVSSLQRATKRKLLTLVPGMHGVVVQPTRGYFGDEGTWAEGYAIGMLRRLGFKTYNEALKPLMTGEGLGRYLENSKLREALDTLRKGFNIGKKGMHTAGHNKESRFRLALMRLTVINGDHLLGEKRMNSQFLHASHLFQGGFIEGLLGMPSWRKLQHDPKFIYDCPSYEYLQDVLIMLANFGTKGLIIDPYIGLRSTQPDLPYTLTMTLTNARRLYVNCKRNDKKRGGLNLSQIKDIKLSRIGAAYTVPQKDNNCVIYNGIVTN